mgnify:CR=1 FL=1
MIVCTSNLTTANRQRIINYLGYKYGIASAVTGDAFGGGQQPARTAELQVTSVPTFVDGLNGLTAVVSDYIEGSPTELVVVYERLT